MLDRELLLRIDAYLDAVPRAVVRTESIGPFTLFVNEGHGWRYYARPTPGALTFTGADITAVRERQRTLDQPEEFEWIVELTPEVGPVAQAGGLATIGHPLMYLPLVSFTPAPCDDVQIEMLAPQDDLEAANAVAHLAFGAPGTSVGPSDRAALDAAVAGADPETIAFTRERLRDGFTRMAVARTDGRVVASGSYQPSEGAAEITGIATLPAYRRRGIGAALTSALVQDAMNAGISTVFLSADDDAVARVYARLGFRIVGQAGAAAPHRDRT